MHPAKKRLGVDIVLDNLDNNPHCPHGPTVKFQRHLAKGKVCIYFACSACRDRKLCSFYLPLGNKVKSLHNEVTKTNQNELYDLHQEKIKIYKTMKLLHPKKRIYCMTCNSFVTNHQQVLHSNCNTISPITNVQLNCPTQFLPAKENAKCEAQYLFSKDSTDILISILLGLKINRILCIGAPRIHEEILRNCKNISSFLLDIDHRFQNFFNDQEFQCYNLFNHHFFGGKKAKNAYKEFINAKDLLLFCDPPFGGRMELISHTLKRIENEWREINRINDVLKVILIFPYFLETAVKQNLPFYTMLDLQINYDNHLFYSKGPKGMRHGSAVRAFVSIPGDTFVPPSHLGYHYCHPCGLWRHPKNWHCQICRTCTSKDGSTYIHCDRCVRCVKPSWQHCVSCNMCQPQDHKCHKHDTKGHQLTQSNKRKFHSAVMKKQKQPKIEIPQSLEEEKELARQVLAQMK